MIEAVTVRFRFQRERDHDAGRRAGEAICSGVLKRGGVIDGIGDRLEAALHPALPPLVIQPAARGLEGQALGWPGGPGFHQAVIATLEAAAEEAGVDLTVEDPTGYHTTRDRALLEARYGALLREAAGSALGFVDRVGAAAEVQLGLPRPGRLDAIRLDGDPPGIFTLEGIRDRAWLEQIHAGALPAAAFYPWWNDPLDDDGARRLGRALVETHLTWRPAKTDRQKALRAVALANLRRGAGAASPELAAVLASLDSRRDNSAGAVKEVSLEELARGAPAMLVGLRKQPRVAVLAGGWSAIVPGHFEELRPDGEPPPGVEAGTLHLDVATRVEPLAQPAPEGISLDERTALLFAQPHAKGATQRRGTGFAGYAIERPLADGATMLVASLVAETTHLIARMITVPGGDTAVARRIFDTIVPDRPAPNLLVI